MGVVQIRDHYLFTVRLIYTKSPNNISHTHRSYSTFLLKSWVIYSFLLLNLTFVTQIMGVVPIQQPGPGKVKQSKKLQAKHKRKGSAKSMVQRGKKAS